MWESRSNCTCNPESIDGYHFVKIIGVLFGDCVRTPREITSFVFGLSSLACFAVAFFPQILLNFRRKSCEGLSVGLLIFWIFGDIGNLVGSVFTNQLALQIFVASYFILLDVVTIGQMVWYGSLRERLGLVDHLDRSELVVSLEDDGDEETDVSRSSRGNRSRQASDILGENAPLLSGSVSSTSNTVMGDPVTKTAVAVVFLTIALVGFFVYSMDAGSIQVGLHYETGMGVGWQESLETIKYCDTRDPITPQRYLIGCAFSWISGLLYFFSRTSQIQANFERKSVEGLSITLFILTLSGNLLYGLQIMVRGLVLDRNFFFAVLPFILGSTGTLIFDTILIYQAWIYGGFR